MTYNSLIPQPSDLISVSQGDLVNNFTSMQNTFSQDHLGFNPIANLGYHKFVTLSGPTADPVGLSFQSSRIYSKSFGTAPNLNTEVYYADQRQSTGQLVSLIPHIKAMATVSSTGVIMTTNTLSINVNTVTPVGSSYTVSFINPLDYDTYYIFMAINNSVNNVPTYAMKMVGSFRLDFSGVPGTFGFMVM